jgi:hemoglobin
MADKKPLQTKEDLERLVTVFYDRVRQDELIGPIFNDVAKVNWDEHIPKIQNFWESLLFGAENYQGRPFPPHIPLDLKPEHFQRWLSLFFHTVDELFIGQKADEIKMRALNIGRNFLANIEHINKTHRIDQ